MTDLRQVAQQALDALREFGYHGSSPRWELTANALKTALEQQQVGPVEDMLLRRAVLRSAKIVSDGRFVTKQAALEQPPLPVQPVQEPVGYVKGTYAGRLIYDTINPAVCLPVGMALYTAPLPVQEPVAWLYPEGFGALQNGKCWTAYPTKHEDCNIPLYTASPQRPWVGLTEQERNDLEDVLGLVIGKPEFDAIEASLKERNT